MRRLGKRKTSTRVAGHQRCGICHPKTKAGRQADNRLWKQEIV